MMKLQRANLRLLMLSLSLFSLSLMVGCEKEGSEPDPNANITPDYDPYYSVSPGEIQFKDEVTAGAQPEAELKDLKFLTLDGQEKAVKDFLGGKNLVLVMTRGYSGSLCIYCSTQTSRLISHYKEIAEKNANVLVVFPIKTPDEKSHLPTFLDTTRNHLDAPPEELPFPVVLDSNLSVVDQLGIRQSLSKPATYILDSEGNVQFAYVGTSIADRPSIKAILKQLETLQPVKTP